MKVCVVFCTTSVSAYIVFALVLITILFTEHIILLYSDISSNGYQFTTRAPVTGSFEITFDPPFNIEPCVEFVSVGDGNQGAALHTRQRSSILIETFHMDGPNLLGIGNISVTGRATGECVRSLQYLRLLTKRDVLYGRVYA